MDESERKFYNELANEQNKLENLSNPWNCQDKLHDMIKDMAKELMEIKDENTQDNKQV